MAPDSEDIFKNHSWSKYENKLHANEEHFVREINVMFRRPLMPNYYHRAKPENLGIGFNKIRNLVLDKYKIGLYKICEKLLSKNEDADEANRISGLRILTHLERQHKKKAMESLKEAYGKKLVQTKHRLVKQQTVFLEETEKKRYVLFSKLVDTSVKKTVYKDMNYFFNRLLWEHKPKVNSSKLVRANNILKKLLISRLGTSFNALRMIRRDIYDDEAVENFVDMMTSQVGNRLSAGFSSIRSYVMHFEVLNVQEIDQDDYKNQFAQAYDKFKVLSERSFEMMPPEGQMDAKQSKILYGAAQDTFNILEPANINQNPRKSLTNIRESSIPDRVPKAEYVQSTVLTTLPPTAVSPSPQVKTFSVLANMNQESPSGDKKTGLNGGKKKKKVSKKRDK